MPEEGIMASKRGRGRGVAGVEGWQDHRRMEWRWLLR